jgi:hypothetical protein
MNAITNTYKFTMALACVSLSLGFLGNNAHAWEYIVRCDKGMNVQRILDSNWLSLPMTLRLVGTCPGFTIEHDDITIAARNDNACPRATVDGGIFINGAHRTELRCIAVTGAEDGAGIFVRGGTATLEEVIIEDNDDIGLSLGSNAYVDVFSSTIRNNGEGIGIERSNASIDDTYVTANAENGVTVEHNSSLEFIEGSLADNGGRGVNVTASSALVLDGTTVSNNSSGVGVDTGSTAQINYANIVNNTRTGLAINLNSSVDVVGGTIAGNLRNGIFLARHSMARIQDSAQIVNNSGYGIRMVLDAGVDLRSGTNVPANGSGYAVFCDSKESSVNYDSSVVIGPIDCIDPDF